MAKTKQLGKPGGIVRKGVITRLSMTEGNEDGSVTVRHGPKPKRDKDGFIKGAFPKETRLDLPNTELGKLTIGQSVEISIVAQPNKGSRQARV